MTCGLRLVGVTEEPKENTARAPSQDERRTYTRQVFFQHASAGDCLRTYYLDPYSFSEETKDSKIYASYIYIYYYIIYIYMPCCCPTLQEKFGRNLLIVRFSLTVSVGGVMSLSLTTSSITQIGALDWWDHLI